MARQPVSPSGRLHSNKRYKKADSLWLKGVWLGRTEQTAEHIVAVVDPQLPAGEQAGVITCRTIRRMEVSKKADKELLMQMQGAPWQAFGLVPRGRRRAKVGADAVMMRELRQPERSSGGAGSVGIADDRANYEEAAAEAAQTQELEANLPPTVLVHTHGDDQGATIGEELEGERGVPATPATPVGVPATPATPARVPASPATIARVPATPATPAAAAPASAVSGSGMDVEISEPRGMKRGASSQLQAPPEGGLGIDVDAVLAVREIETKQVHTADCPELNEEIPIEDMPDLDIEMLLNKNSTEIEPNWETAEEDIKKEKIELQVFWDWKAFELVPRSEVKQDKLVDVKWVTEWRGKQGWRTRCVAREYRWLDQRDDVFAPTTMGATARLVDALAIKRCWHTFTADATKAYLQVEEPEEVYVIPPPEFQEMLQEKDMDPSLCWRMLKILNGRRTGAMRWVNWATNKLRKIDFDVFKGAPYLFKHIEREIILELHMDDYYGCSKYEDAVWLRKALGDEVQLKGFEIHGLAAKYSHLKRARERLPGTMRIMPNPKYIAAVLRLLGLEDCKAVSTPSVERGRGGEDEDDEEDLNPQEQHLFRKVMGILNYFAHERPDVQYTVRMLGQNLTSAKRKHVRQLKRLGRYLRGTSDYCLEINTSQLKENVIRVEGDADWAGDPETRRSVTAGTLYWDKAPMASWSRLQAVRALSSGESEYYQLTTAGAEALFMKSVLAFVGEECRIELYTDSAAAIGISQRAGTGKVRHLDLRLLWIQDGLRENLFRVCKISSSMNTGDLGTKPLSAQVIMKHLRAMGYKGMQLSGKAMASLLKTKKPMGSKSWANAALAAIMAGSGVKAEKTSTTVAMHDVEKEMQEKRAPQMMTMMAVAIVTIILCSVIQIATTKICEWLKKESRDRMCCAEAMTQTEPAELQAKFHLMRVDELKNECMRRRISIAGFKDELIERLYRHTFEGLS
eukprot:632282-Amphidinium_carterae.4